MSKAATPSYEHTEHLATITKAKGFLGREFLTWLWYLAEKSDEQYTVRDDTQDRDLEFDFWVDDRIVLEASAGHSHEAVMKGGDPSQSREAAVALVTGKTVKEMKLGLNVKNIGEFSAVISADDLNPRSLKLPSPNKGDGASNADDLPIVTRLRHMETFLTIFDGLFARFLSLRVEDNWEKSDLQNMRDWIKVRSAKSVETLH